MRVEDYKKKWEETKRTFESMITFKRSSSELMRHTLTEEMREVFLPANFILSLGSAWENERIREDHLRLSQKV
jgi:hypothetical protein